MKKISRKRTVSSTEFWIKTQLLLLVLLLRITKWKLWRMKRVRNREREREKMNNSVICVEWKTERGREGKGRLCCNGGESDVRRERERERKFNNNDYEPNRSSRAFLSPLSLSLFLSPKFVGCFSFPKIDPHSKVLLPLILILILFWFNPVIHIDRSNIICPFQTGKLFSWSKDAHLHVTKFGLLLPTIVFVSCYNIVLW